MHDRPYADDLAYIHDVGYGGFAAQSAPEILAILRGSGICEGLVVDLGCGSGIWARELTKAGYIVRGVDISAAMVRIARKRVPTAHFQVGSFLDATLPPCDAVTALGECFNYLFDHRNGLPTLTRLFRQVHASLRPNGLLVFDVAEPGRGRGQYQGFRQEADWACLVKVEEDARRKRLTRHITTYRRIGKRYRRHDERHHLQLYRAAEVAASLRNAGFRVRTVRSYGQFPLPQGIVGFLARKP